MAHQILVTAPQPPTPAVYRPTDVHGSPSQMTRSCPSSAPPSPDDRRDLLGALLARAVASRGRTDGPSLSAPGGTRLLQRLVVRLRSKIDENKPDDLTELVSVAFALERTRGPVVNFRQASFKDVRTGELIVFLGHGSPGTTKGVTAEQLADSLTHPETGIPSTATNVTLMFQSCYAGADMFLPGTSGTQDEPHSSVVAKLSSRLATRHRSDINVVGGVGPTVKAPVLGDHFYVIKHPSQTPAVKNQLDENPELSSKTLQTRYDTWLEARKVEGTEPSIQEQAKAASEICKDRTVAFVDALKVKSTLHDDSTQAGRAESIRMYRGGGEVTDAATKDQIFSAILSSRI